MLVLEASRCRYRLCCHLQAAVAAVTAAVKTIATATMNMSATTGALIEVARGGSLTLALVKMVTSLEMVATPPAGLTSY